MPQYVVQLEGGGEMRVNASSPEAARQNVSGTGNTPAGGGGGSGGGGGGGGATAIQAADGQTLSSQSPETQASFRAVYGDQADAKWAAEHNAAIGQPGPGTTTSSGGGGGQTYATVNGTRTVAQMGAELKAAGWQGNPDDPAAVTGAYASTTKGPVSQGAGTAAGGTGSGAVPPTNKPQVNVDQVNSDFDRSMQQAYQVYLNAKLNLDTDELAFKKATQAFQNSLAEAGLTGMWNGQPTQAAQQQEFQQGVTAAGLTGTYEGAPTLTAQQQYWNQAFEQQKQQQSTVQAYLQLLSGLRGPQDYGQYLRVLQSTPGGLQDLVRGAAGANPVSGFGTTGVSPNPVTLGGFMNQAAGGPGAPGAPAGTPGGTSYADYQAAAQNLPPPSQIAPQAWNSMSDSQKKMLLGMYESNGWNVTDAQQQYAASLPKYGSTAPQSGGFKLV